MNFEDKGVNDRDEIYYFIAHVHIFKYPEPKSKTLFTILIL